MNYLPLQERQQKTSKFNIVLNIIIIFLIVVVLAQTMFYSRYSRVYVVGSSMSPTLTGAVSDSRSGGDYVYIDRNATPERGNIVVIQTDTNVIIKRVIALAGDTVELRQGVLYLNGEKQDEDYIAAYNNSATKEVNTFAAETVKEGCIFVMGDNRNNSSDSRNKYGDISLTRVVGVVTNWSMEHKQTITDFNTFFDFTIKGK